MPPNQNAERYSSKAPVASNRRARRPYNGPWMNRAVMNLAAILLAASAQTVALPQNPCDVLDPGTVSAVAGVQISVVRHAVSISETVRAQREGRAERSGTICVYETPSDFVSITVAVPEPEDRQTAKYWDARKSYFTAYRGSARPVPGVGVDAWLGGGADLHVLIADDEFIMLGTQMYQPRSGTVLVALARAALARLGR